MANWLDKNVNMKFSAGQIRQALKVEDFQAAVKERGYHLVKEGNIYRVVRGRPPRTATATERNPPIPEVEKVVGKPKAVTVPKVEKAKPKAAKKKLAADPIKKG